MDYKSGIYEKLSQYLDYSSEQATEDLYYKIVDLLQERDHDKAYSEIVNYFCLKYIYYYNPTTNLYIEYTTDFEFKFINENNMIHIILQFLTKYHETYSIESSLKQRLKYKIIKKIKGKHIYQNIPESITLQNILNFLHPNFFNQKMLAKYFMITLGDIIMKKTDLFYFLPIHMKPFLKTLNKHISMYFHTMNICNHYKFQYYDHDTSKSRVIPFNSMNLQHFTIPESFYNNLICVSLHYSNRYSSSDEFLEEACCQSIKQNVLWIKYNEKEQIINSFIENHICIKEGYTIHEKDMLFIWKDYLKTSNKINVFQKNSEIHSYISKKISFHNGCYINVTSMFLPCVNHFKDFWEKYMYRDTTDYAFEISEIFQIFIETFKDKNIEEHSILDLIQYYYPDVKYLDNKIYNIGCTLWNKKKEIDLFLLKLKVNVNINFIDTTDLYSLYCNKFANKKKVSKLYFTQYIQSIQLIN